jgi:hypothetical protein
LGFAGRVLELEGLSYCAYLSLAPKGARAAQVRLGVHVTLVVPLGEIIILLRA